MHRTVLVMVRHAHQIRELIAPDHAAGLGDPAGTAVENSIDQPTAVNQHQGAGAGHSLTGAWGFGLDTEVHLAGHRGFQVPATAAAALLKGIGARSDGLSLESGQRPPMGHLTAHHTHQVGLDTESIDGPELSTAAAELQFTPVTALAQPDATGIIGVHLKQAAGREPLRLAIQFRQQRPTAQGQHQATQRAGTPWQTAHLKQLRAVGPQGEALPLLHQHAHLRFTPQGHSSWRSDSADDGTAHQGDDRSETHATSERVPVCPACPGPARWQHVH